MDLSSYFGLEDKGRKLKLDALEPFKERIVRSQQWTREMRSVALLGGVLRKLLQALERKCHQSK